MTSDPYRTYGAISRANLRQRRAAQRQPVDGRLVHPDAPHGTAGGYQNWTCRCQPCTDANVTARARWRKDDPQWTLAAHKRRSAQAVP